MQPVKFRRACSGALLLLSTSIALPAFSDNVDCGPDNIIEHRKPLIHFEPFPMKDPETGKEYHPNDLVDVPDENGDIKKVKASNYFGRLNSIEEQLNTWGYSLRTDGVDNISSLNYCAKRLESQVKVINEYVRDQEMKFLKNPEEWKNDWEKAWEEYKKDIPSWEDLYRYAEDDDYDVYMPEVPVFHADRPVFERKPVEFTKEKTYTLYKGSNKTFAVGIYPYYKIGATKVEAKGEAGVNVEGAILGAWKGSVANIAIKAQSPGTGPLTLDLVASVIDGRKTWNKPLVKTGALRYDDNVKASIAKSVSYRFAIGPIPCKGEVGLRGEAGFQWGIELYPLQVGAYTGPWAAADAYAQVGADIFVAGVGAGGRLLLASYQLTLQGTGTFEWVDEPLIKLNMALVSDLELLSGEIYGYAYVYYPILWPPFKKKKTWRHTFFDWKGYKKKGSLFDYSATVSRNGLVAEGDLSPEDVLEMNHINREAYVEELEEKALVHTHDIMASVVEDIASDANRKIGVSAAQVNALTKQLQERQDQYWKHLNEVMSQG